MKCPVCSAEASSGASFCQYCGAKLPLLESDDSTTEVMADSPQAASTSPPASRATSGRGRGPDVPEETLWQGSYSPRAMLGMAIVCGMFSLTLLIMAIMATSSALRWSLLLLIVVMWFALAARLAAKRLGVAYKLTNQMFYHRRGLMTRTTDRVELIEIHDVTWQQGLFERLTNVGTVIISSADRTHPNLPLHGIEHVEEVANKIDRARRGEQVRRGRRIDFSSIDGQT